MTAPAYLTLGQKGDFLVIAGDPTSPAAGRFLWPTFSTVEVSEWVGECTTLNSNRPYAISRPPPTIMRSQKVNSE